MKKLIGLLVTATILGVVVVAQPLARGGGGGRNTPTPTATVGGETPTLTPTPTPTEEVPTPTPTPAETTDPPSTGENLLVNGDFNNGLQGWSYVNGHWLVHPPVECDPSITGYYDGSYAEGDQDASGGWEVGQEDWLWQDVAAPVHDSVTLVIHEAHHQHTDSYPVVTVYGSNDGSNWTTLFTRVGVASPGERPGKCSSAISPSRRLPPETNTYVFAGGFSQLRLELHYKLVTSDDGVLIAFELYTD